MGTLTANQRKHVVRVTQDRVGRRETVVDLDAWRKAIAFTAWELYRV